MDIDYINRCGFGDIRIILDEYEAQLLSDTIEDAINHVGYPPSIRKQLEKLSNDLICHIVDV